MRNERGFFTIVGLCLLLAAALCIQGVQEFEENYSVGAKSFQVEHELQNAADSALVEAAEKIRIIGVGNFQKHFDNEPQPKIEVSPPPVSDLLKNFSIEVYAERKPVARYNRTYSAEEQYKDKPVADENHNWVKFTTIIISVASCDSNFIDGKIYRCALAYVIDDDSDTKDIDESAVIYFINGSTTKFNGW